MFIQIHLLQSMPPGNLNRDDTGQPKKCFFGGVTRGRISSQCLKRNIRTSDAFAKAFGEKLGQRTTYLPRMVGDELTAQKIIPEEDIEAVKAAFIARFSKEDKGGGDDAKDEAKSSGGGESVTSADQTPQLVFFNPIFARRIAELVGEFRQRSPKAYDKFVGRGGKGKAVKEETKALDAEIKYFEQEVFAARESLSVDVGLFGRMTTSDLVANVEAACQVAHAMSTHEVLIESDYFTAMDDRKSDFATTQVGAGGAAFLGSGDTETFFSSAVYYKYLNVDLDALAGNLRGGGAEELKRVAGVLVEAAALATPTGKQNSFAAHSNPELILVEISTEKRPVSYANAFLQAVEGGAGRNLMSESAKALDGYIESVAAAFAPTDTRRFLLAVGHAASGLHVPCDRVKTLSELVAAVNRFVATSAGQGVTA